MYSKSLYFLTFDEWLKRSRRWHLCVDYIIGHLGEWDIVFLELVIKVHKCIWFLFKCCCYYNWSRSLKIIGELNDLENVKCRATRKTITWNRKYIFKCFEKKKKKGEKMETIIKDKSFK